MLRIFQHDVAGPTLAELLADGSVYFIAALIVWARPAVDLGALPSGSSTVGDALIVAALFSTSMALMYAFMGVYRPQAAGVSLVGSLSRTLLAVVIGMSVATFALGIAKGSDYAMSLAGRTVPFIAIGALLTRSLSFVFQRASVGAQRVLIVGTGKEALAVASEIAASAATRHVVVGFYPTSGSAAADADRPGVFSTALSIDQIVRKYQVQQVIVAVREQRGGGLPMDQLVACRIGGVPVLDLAGFSESSKGEVPIDSLKASWLVYGHGFAQGRFRRWIKRLFDIVSASALLIVTSPLMLLVAIAIRIEGGGPILYRQERVGLAGRVFMCPKFRSMRVDAEPDGVARWADEADDRITRVGAFIRKTRMDELPQLVTVLRGEMSLVGPRPERPCFVSLLEKQVPFYGIRHSVKPGITGWAQVRYTYGASVEDAGRKHQFDLYYVKNNSLLLDLLILIQTVNVVLFGVGSR